MGEWVEESFGCTCNLASHSLGELALSCFLLVIYKLVLTLPDPLVPHRLWLLGLAVTACSSRQGGLRSRGVLWPARAGRQAALSSAGGERHHCVSRESMFLLRACLCSHGNPGAAHNFRRKYSCLMHSAALCFTLCSHCHTEFSPVSVEILYIELAKNRNPSFSVSATDITDSIFTFS